MSQSNTYQTICRNIHWLRTHHQMTRQEMAAIMGISTGTLGKIERGTPNCRINCWMIRRLCDYFELSADSLLREALDKPL